MIWRAYPLAFAAAVACLGYGSALSRFLTLDGNLGDGINLGDAGILGLATIALLGCLLHFFLALSPTVEAVVLLVGAALCLLFRARLVHQFRLQPISILVGLSVFLQRHAVTVYDTGLYHLQSVQWNSQFPITPGLGNLHGRLAFNSLLFVLAPLDDRPAFGWISNLLLLLFVLMSCHRRLSQAGRNTVEFWSLALTIGLLALGAGALEWLGLLNADAFVAVLTVYWFAVVLAPREQHRTNLPLLLVAAALAVTVKLSAAPLLLLALLAAWFYRKTVVVTLRRPVVVVAVLLALWAARGLTLSGCAAYPLPQSCVFRLPWSVSSVQAKYEMISTTWWARLPQQFDYTHELSPWAWLAPWSRRLGGYGSVHLLIAGLLAAGASLAFGTRIGRRGIILCAALAFCLAYWFFAAPDVRFASGYLAVGGILGLSFAAAAWFPRSDLIPRLTLETVALAALLGAASLVQSGNSWSVPPLPPFTRHTTSGGKSVWVSPTGFLGGDQCWDHPLPCSPFFHPLDLDRVRWR